MLDGPQAGVTGFTTSTFYTMDFAAIPNSATPTALAAPWQTSGYVAVAPFTESSLVIGSPDEPASAGSAFLAGGAVVEVSSVALGGVGDGTLTVADPGTELRVPNNVFTTNGDSAINVVNGARLSSALIFRGGAGLLDIHVDGAGSVLDLQASQDVSALGQIGIAGIFNAGSPPTRPGTVTVSDGGHIDIIGHGNTPAPVCLDGRERGAHRRHWLAHSYPGRDRRHRRADLDLSLLGGRQFSHCQQWRVPRVNGLERGRQRHRARCFARAC